MRSRFFLWLLSALICGAMTSLQSPATAEPTTDPASIGTLPPSKLEHLAALYLKLGQTNDCRAALDALLKTRPRSTTALRLLARLEFRVGRYAEAAKAADDALAITADDADAMTVKAAALRALGRNDEASKAVASLTGAEVARREDSLALNTTRTAQKADDSPTPDEPKDDPDFTAADAVRDTALDAAREAIDKRRWKAADELTTTALKQWPHNHEAIELRADFLAGAERPAEAIPLYQKLKHLHDPATGPFPQQIDLAFALNDAGRKEEARAAFALVISDTRYPKKDRQQAAAVLKEQREQELLAQGNAALDAGRKDEAARLCETLIAEGCDSPDTRLFHADVLEAQGRHAEAAPLYAEAKKAVPTKKRFDSQLNYAGALAGSLDYRAASSAFEEIIKGPSLYSADEIREAQEAWHDLHEDHFPQLNTELVAGEYDEGNLLRTKSRFHSMRSGTRRFIIDADWDNIALEPQLFPAERKTDRVSATVGIEQRLSTKWSGTFLLGGFNGGVMGSVAADYTGSHGLTATLRLAANDPARDTLLLEAMDGRQHSLSAEVTSPLGKHFAVDSTFLARDIEIDGASIGQAIGLEAQFRWHPFEVTTDTWLAYALELKGFSADEESFDRSVRRFFGTKESPLMPEVYDAVPRRINRHALQAHSSIPLTKRLTAGLTGEVAWRQEVQKVEYSVISELRWRISAHADLSARVEYDTGGAGPNTNGSVTLGTLALRYTW